MSVHKITKIQEIVDILHGERNITQEQQKQLLESLTYSDRELLHDNFDLFLDYLMTAATNLQSMPETVLKFTEKLLQSQSLKYSIVMILQKIVDGANPIISRYVLQHFSYRYFDLADKSYDTLKQFMENGVKIREQVKEDLETQLTNNLNNKQTTEVIKKLGVSSLPADKFFQLFRLLSVDHTQQETRQAIGDLIAEKQLTLSMQTPTPIMLQLYFNKSTQYLYSDSNKFRILSSHLNQNTVGFLLEQLVRLIKLINHEEHLQQLPTVIFHLLKYIGSQGCTNRKAVGDINITNEFVWQRVLQMADEPNFKAFCLNKHRQLSKNKKFCILIDVCQSFAEIGKEHVELLTEIVNYGLFLKMKGKQMPPKFRERMEEVRGAKMEGPDVEILLFRLDQLL